MDFCPATVLTDKRERRYPVPTSWQSKPSSGCPGCQFIVRLHPRRRYSSLNLISSYEHVLYNRQHQVHDGAHPLLGRTAPGNVAGVSLLVYSLCWSPSAASKSFLLLTKAIASRMRWYPFGVPFGLSTHDRPSIISGHFEKVLHESTSRVIPPLWTWRLLYLRRTRGLPAKQLVKLQGNKGSGEVSRDLLLRQTPYYL